MIRWGPIFAEDGNERSFRKRYAPRRAATRMKSTYRPAHVVMFGDAAFSVGPFSVERTDRVGGKTRYAAGRLALGYRSDAQAGWRIVLDVDDNQGESELETVLWPVRTIAIRGRRAPMLDGLGLEPRTQWTLKTAP